MKLNIWRQFQISTTTIQHLNQFWVLVSLCVCICNISFEPPFSNSFSSPQFSQVFDTHTLKCQWAQIKCEFNFCFSSAFMFGHFEALDRNVCVCVYLDTSQMKLNSALRFISVGFEDVFLCFNNKDKFIGRSICIAVNRKYLLLNMDKVFIRGDCKRMSAVEWRHLKRKKVNRWRG